MIDIDCTNQCKDSFRTNKNEINKKRVRIHQFEIYERKRDSQSQNYTKRKATMKMKSVYFTISYYVLNVRVQIGNNDLQQVADWNPRNNVNGIERKLHLRLM